MSTIHRFIPNRVQRLYLGGAGIDAMRGHPPRNGYCPEDWIASCIEANTREFVHEGHGLSQVDIDGTLVYFSDLLKEHAHDMLGPDHVETHGEIPGVLTKLLDSAIRLPIQVHPSREDANTYFNAPFGKTEAWIILSCQPDAYLYLGFNERLNKDVFRQESKDGTYRHSLDMMHRLAVRPGDVAMVYGGLPHAIGEGITMVEVMEPSDITIVPESMCGDRPIAPEMRFAQLPPDRALDLFDYTPYSEDTIRQLCFPPRQEMAPGYFRIIDRKKEKFFGAEELQLKAPFDLPLEPRCFRIAILAEGHATINDSMELRAGESAFLPYNMKRCRIEGHGTMIFILPPLTEPTVPACARE